MSSARPLRYTFASTVLQATNPYRTRNARVVPTHRKTVHRHVPTIAHPMDRRNHLKSVGGREGTFPLATVGRPVRFPHSARHEVGSDQRRVAVPRRLDAPTRHQEPERPQSLAHPPPAFYPARSDQHRQEPLGPAGDRAPSLRPLPTKLLSLSRTHRECESFGPDGDDCWPGSYARRYYFVARARRADGTLYFPAYNHLIWSWGATRIVFKHECRSIRTAGKRR